MSYKSIYETLISRLQTVTTLPTLQKENNRVQLGSGKTAWCRATLLPAKSMISTIGNNGYTESLGLFQIDLFYPADGSYTDAFTMVDTILNKFIPGTVLSGITVKNSWAESAQTINTQSTTIPNYYMQPILIEWSLYSQRDTIV